MYLFIVLYIIIKPATSNVIKIENEKFVSNGHAIYIVLVKLKALFIHQY